MTAYVGDFGLARFLPTNVTNPMKGQSNSAAVWGSIGYVPPEYGMGGSLSTQGEGLQLRNPSARDNDRKETDR